MNTEQLNWFKHLWKVNVIINLKQFADKETTITRNEINSLERDLSFIKYGFEEGLKYNRLKEVK